MNQPRAKGGAGCAGVAKRRPPCSHRDTRERRLHTLVRQLVLLPTAILEAAETESTEPALVGTYPDEQLAGIGSFTLPRTFLYDGSGELIFYRRAGAAGPTISRYDIAPVADADSLRRVLREALGEAGRVRKLRSLYMAGRSRIHVDEVEGLGDFVELEVVLADGESEESGEREARGLMAALEIEEDDLIDRSYVDLMKGEDG